MLTGVGVEYAPPPFTGTVWEAKGAPVQTGATPAAKGPNRLKVMVPVGGAPKAPAGGGGGLSVAVSVVVAGIWAPDWAAVVDRPGVAWRTVVWSVPLLRTPGGAMVGPVAVELATWLVWTLGAPAFTSVVGTRRVMAGSVTTHVVPVG